MDAGTWVAILAIVVGLLTTGIGAGWTVFTRQNDQLRERIRTLEADLKVAQATTVAQNQLVSELKLQNSKLEITSQIQDKFFNDLRRSIHRTEGGDAA